MNIKKELKELLKARGYIMISKSFYLDEECGFALVNAYDRVGSCHAIVYNKTCGYLSFQLLSSVCIHNVHREDVSHETM